ncbi:MAG: DNA polymerase III subunit beta [Lentisphaeria bacterium]
MKITVKKNALSDVLRKVLSAVNTKTTIPVLNNVHLEASGDSLAVAATDLEVFIRSKAVGNVEREGKTTLPARKFGQIISALPDGDIVLETDENEQTSISCERSFFRMVGLSAEEFPTEDDEEGEWNFTLPASAFKKMLDKVSYAASTDESRHVLNGILLSIREGVVTSVGTDGRRLALLESPLDNENAADGDVILPPKVIGELIKLLDQDKELNIQLTESRASFLLSDTLITSKLVEGSYPNYRQVIPGGFNNSAVLPRDAFAEAVNRVAMVVTESSSSVRLNLENGKATVSASSAEVGESNEPLEVSYEGEPLDISLNPQFLMEPLRHMECDQVVLQFNDQFSPVSISGDEGFLYIIMPMRT